jgi:predicted PolB exonuclease-like 3'-5' exonuclease
VIYAFDIETIPDPDALEMMPEPEVALGNTKDPAKIAEKIADAKRKQVEKAALDPLTARIVCASFANASANRVVIGTATDERSVMRFIFERLGEPEARFVTWNGAGFDFPMVYRRAAILGICPAEFGAPPLPAWVKRYNTDRHYDLMQIWTGWSGFASMDAVARMVLGRGKMEFDVSLIHEMIRSEQGRAEVAKYCDADARLTWELFTAFEGTLFA